MKINKRATAIFSLLLVSAFIGLMITTLVLFMNKYNELSKNKQIGERQMELLNAYSKGEKAMFYIDRAAEIAAEEAVYDLGEAGGHIGFKCGDIDGYAVWVSPEEECYPSGSDLLNSYEDVFNMKMAYYLYAYPDEQVKMPNLFELALSSSLNILGTAVNDLVVGLPKQPQVWMGGAPGSVSASEFMGIPGMDSIFMAHSYSKNEVEYIMLHHTGGATAEAAIRTIANRGLSCHYVVDKDGTVVQLIPEERGAACAGSGTVPDMNTRAIQIEIVNPGNGKDPYPDEQVESVFNLVSYLIDKYNIQPDHLVGHGWHTTRKQCCEPCGFPYDFIDGWNVQTRPC